MWIVYKRNYHLPLSAAEVNFPTIIFVQGSFMKKNPLNRSAKRYYTFVDLVLFLCT